MISLSGFCTFRTNGDLSVKALKDRNKIDWPCVFQYVAMVITFQLLRTSVTFREQLNVPEILKIQMINLSTKICQRPGAQAVR